MKTVFRLILFSPILSIIGCGYNATATLYKTPEKITLNRIGFVDLTSDSISQENYHLINDIFRSSAVATWQEFHKDSLLYISKHNSYYYPDTNEIAYLCGAQKVDGIILSSIKLIQTNTSVWTSVLFLPIPLGTYPSFDTEVKLKLLDKKGSLIISISYYTRDAGKSQSKTEKIDLVIRDGVRGAVRGMIKEMKTEGYAFYD